MIEQWWPGRTGWTAIVMACVAAISLADAAIAASPAYDGVYSGESTRTRGDESICGKSPNQVSYTVVNGQFSMIYDPAHHVGVNLVVQPDGSFSGDQAYIVGNRQSRVKASGHIAGNVLTAQIEGDACARSYQLTKH